MESVAHWYLFYSVLIAVPLIAIVAIYFHVKNRTTPTLVLAIGLCLIPIGALLQIVAGAARTTFDDMGNILSHAGPPAAWYIGSILSSTGLLVATIGFALVAFKLKCSSTLQSN